MIFQFPIDDMHGVDLGAMRKQFFLFLKYGLFDSNAADEFIKACLKFIPSDFTRKPRLLKFLDHFKATELRMFALYLAIVMFKKCGMSDKHYEMFKLFFCGYRILMGVDGNCSLEDCDIAEKLFSDFVKEFHDNFSELSYNFHCLLHLTDMVRKNGPLFRYSAYPFENFYQLFRHWIRKPSDIFKQIWTRWNQNRGIVTRKNEKKKSFYSMHVDTSKRNNYIMTKNNELLMITQKIVHPGNVSFVGQKFEIREPFFTTPINSKSLNIFVLSEHSLNTEQMNIQMSDIKTKMFKVPYENEKFVVLPVLHY